MPKPNEYVKIGEIVGKTEEIFEQREKWQKKWRAKKWLMKKCFRWTNVLLMGHQYVQMFDDWTQGNVTSKTPLSVL